MRVRALLGAVLLIPLACSGAGGWQGTLEERDGVVYVSNPREGLWQERAAAPIRFELEQTFGVDVEPEEAILGVVGRDGVAVDDDGNVYIYDYTAAQIFSFASDGSLRWRAGGPGQGPGEIFDAEGLVWDGATSIYLSNASLKRLDQWSTSGVFIAVHALADRDLPTGRAIGFVEGSTLALGSSLSARRPGSAGGVVLGLIDMASMPWTEVAEIEIDVIGAPLPFYGASVDVNVTGGVVTVADFDNYELRIFDGRGNLRRVISRDFARIIGYPVDDQPSSPYSFLAAPVALPSGHWLTLLGWVDVADPAADWRRRKASDDGGEYPRRWALDLFDPDGRFLYSIEGEGRVPGIGAPLFVGPDDRLYTSMQEPYPHVRRYRVEIDS